MPVADIVESVGTLLLRIERANIFKFLWQLNAVLSSRFDEPSQRWDEFFSSYLAVIS